MATLKDIAKLAKVPSATVSELHPKKLDNKSNFLGCFSMKLSYEDKIEIYRLRQSGWTWSKISQTFNISKYNLQYMVRLIDIHGLESVCKRKNRYYSPELKQEIINEVLIKGRSQLEVSLDYGLPNKEMLPNWIAQYKKNGYTILEKSRGRPVKMGRTTPIETRGNVAMMGNLGYELDLTSLPESDKEVIATQVSYYKDIRPVVQFGKHYRLINPEQGANEAAVQFVYEDKTFVTYVRTLSTIETTLKLKGLEADALYHLQETGQVFSGAELMYAGLTVTLPQGDYLSKQYYFVKQ